MENIDAPVSPMMIDPTASPNSNAAESDLVENDSGTAPNLGPLSAELNQSALQRAEAAVSHGAFSPLEEVPIDTRPFLSPNLWAPPAPGDSTTVSSHAATVSNSGRGQSMQDRPSHILPTLQSSALPARINTSARYHEERRRLCREGLATSSSLEARTPSSQAGSHTSKRSFEEVQVSDNSRANLRMGERGREATRARASASTSGASPASDSFACSSRHDSRLTTNATPRGSDDMDASIEATTTTTTTAHPDRKRHRPSAQLPDSSSSTERDNSQRDDGSSSQAPSVNTFTSSPSASSSDPTDSRQRRPYAPRGDIPRPARRSDLLLPMRYVGDDFATSVLTSHPFLSTSAYSLHEPARQARSGQHFGRFSADGFYENEATVGSDHARTPWTTLHDDTSNNNQRRPTERSANFERPQQSESLGALESFYWQRWPYMDGPLGLPIDPLDDYLALRGRVLQRPNSMRQLHDATESNTPAESGRLFPRHRAPAGDAYSGQSTYSWADSESFQPDTAESYPRYSFLQPGNTAYEAEYPVLPYVRTASPLPLSFESEAQIGREATETSIHLAVSSAAESGGSRYTRLDPPNSGQDAQHRSDASVPATSGAESITLSHPRRTTIRERIVQRRRAGNSGGQDAQHRSGTSVPATSGAESITLIHPRRTTIRERIVQIRRAGNSGDQDAQHRSNNLSSPVAFGPGRADPGTPPWPVAPIWNGSFVESLRVFTFQEWTRERQEKHIPEPVPETARQYKGKGKARALDDVEPEREQQEQHNLREAQEQSQKVWSHSAASSERDGSYSSPSESSPTPSTPSSSSLSSQAEQSTSGPSSKATVVSVRCDGPESCAICLEPYEPESKLAETWCKHIFHEDCVKKWLFGSFQCPLCRAAAPGFAYLQMSNF